MPPKKNDNARAPDGLDRLRELYAADRATYQAYRDYQDKPGHVSGKRLGELRQEWYTAASQCRVESERMAVEMGVPKAVVLHRSFEGVKRKRGVGRAK